MDMVSLRTFQAVLDKGGIKPAAEHLHTVQSNITARIQRLERDLDVKLFYREGRRMMLTQQGRVLQDYAARILRLEEEAVLQVRNQADEGGELRIGAMESSAAVRMPPFLAQVRQHFPKVRLTLRTAHTQQLIADVLAHKIDCAFVGGMVENPQLVCEPLYREELVLVSAADTGARADAQDDVLILFADGCAYRDRAMLWQASQNRAFSEVMELSSLDCILGCVAAGMGVSVLPRSVFERQSPYCAGLVQTALPASFANIQTCFIRHKALQETALLKSLPDLARASVQVASVQVHVR